MKTGKWQYDPETGIVTADIAYQLTDPLTGEVIPKVGKLELPASEIAGGTLDEITAQIAAAASPKTASKGEVAVAVKADIAVLG